jgi:hypothetical protein
MISEWFKDAIGLSEFEYNQIDRLITYLRTVERSYEDKDTIEEKSNDLVEFTKQYSIRKNKDIKEIFPKEFYDWMIAI